MVTWHRLTSVLCCSVSLAVPQLAYAQGVVLPSVSEETRALIEESTRAKSLAPGVIDYGELMSRSGTNSFIVEFQDNNDGSATSAQSLSAASAMGATISQVRPNTFEIEVPSFAIDINDQAENRAEVQSQRLNSVADALREDPFVERFFPNYKLSIQTDDTASLLPTDPHFGRQWHYMDSGAVSDGMVPGGTGIVTAWEVLQGSNEIVVAVLDTGLDYAHEDLDTGNIVPGYDFISDTSVAADGDGRDPDPSDPGDACRPFNRDSWHGTHVAGTVGAAKWDNDVGIVGVNRSVSIMPVRVLGKCGGSLDDILLAMRWAADIIPDDELTRLELPKVARKADIINMSLGGPGVCLPEIAEIFDEITASGTLVIVAAGNDSSDAASFFPSSCASALSVAAGDFSGNLAPYSNFGDSVLLIAPGGNIAADENSDGFADGVLSLVKDSYQFYNGTSMAAPHVAGVAALIKSAVPAATPDQLIETLVGTATPVDTNQCGRPCGRRLEASWIQDWIGR